MCFYILQFHIKVTCFIDLHLSIHVYKLYYNYKYVDLNK